MTFSGPGLNSFIESQKQVGKKNNKTCAEIGVGWLKIV